MIRFEQTTPAPKPPARDTAREMANFIKDRIASSHGVTDQELLERFTEAEVLHHADEARAIVRREWTRQANG